MAVRLHPPAARLVAFCEGNINPALIGLGPAFDHGPIAFADFTLLEQLAEQRQCLAMTPQHKAARCIAVEAVRQRGCARQTETQCVEIVFKGIAALGAAMHRQSCRLVDHQHQPIAIKEAAEHLFRCHAETAITGAA